MSCTTTRPEVYGFPFPFGGEARLTALLLGREVNRDESARWVPVCILDYTDADPEDVKVLIQPSGLAAIYVSEWDVRRDLGVGEPLKMLGEIRESLAARERDLEAIGNWLPEEELA